MATAPITLNEMADELGIDAATLRTQIRNHRLTATKVGPIWTVTPAEVARYKRESLGQAGHYPRKRARRRRN